MSARPALGLGPGGPGMFRGGPGGRRGGPREDARTATTAADGGFRLAGLEAGAWSVTAHKDGLADSEAADVSVSAGAAPPPLALRLGLAAEISGVVRRPNGDGAAGYRVLARPQGAEGPALFGGARRDVEPTGADGVFRLTGLRAGQAYEIVALSREGPGPRASDVLAPAQDVVLAAPGLGAIRGRVTDARTGAPVTPFSAAQESEGRGGPGRRGGPPWMAPEDADGAEPQPSVDGSFQIDDVPAGRWAVVVRAPGYRTARVGGVEVKEGAATEGVELRLVHGASLRGRVTDARTQAPIADASVETGAADAPGWGRPESAVRTDANGGFAIEGLAEGAVRVTVRHPAYAEASQSVTVGEDGGWAEVALGTGSAIAGVVVTSAGRPVAGAEVGLGRGGPGGGSSATTDDAGRFRIDRLAPGRYSLTASAEGRTARAADVVLQAGQAREDVVITLGGGATLQGRVTGLPADRLAGVSVTARGPSGFAASTRTAANGAFELASLPSGAIDLAASSASSAGMRTATSQVVIAEGETTADAEIAFAAKGSLSGTVTRAGAPVPGAMVAAGAVNGPPAAAARTDEGGAYRLEGLADGPYTLTAMGVGGAAHTRAVTVSGDTAQDIDLPAARLSGQVVDADSREPVGGAVVELAGSAGLRGTPRATTDDNGRFDLEGLEPRGYAATVRKGAYRIQTLEVTPAEEGASVTVELQRADGLLLRATDGLAGVPLRTLLVRVQDAGGARVFEGPVALDGAGNGEMSSLAAGTYRLRAGSPGYATLEWPLAVPSPRVELRLTPGGVLEIHAGPQAMAGSRVARVTRADGSPAVLSPFDDEGTVRLDAPVRRVEHLAAGPYRVSMDGGPPRDAAVAEGATAVVELP